MSIANTEQVGRRSGVASVPAWLFAGAAVYLLLLVRGDSLLIDPDMFWQIKVGQWIVAQHAVPFTDVYSFTRAGAPWMSSSWLSQMLLAEAFDLGGWAGVVILSALAAAAPSRCSRTSSAVSCLRCKRVWWWARCRCYRCHTSLRVRTCWRCR